MNTREHLNAMYLARFGAISRVANWDTLALEISKKAGRSKPWSGRYIRSIANGDRGFTDPPAVIVETVAGMDTGEPSETTHRNSAVLSITPLPPNTIVMGSPRRCAWCGIWFVPPYANQKYHTDECRRLAKNHRAKIRRKERKHGS